MRCFLSILRIVVPAGLLVAGVTGAGPLRGAPQIDYNRHIRPLLAEYCLPCHGPDADRRQAGLRLDREEDARALLGSGARAIVPGRKEQSEMLLRLRSEDADLRMPPPEASRHPAESEIALLERWVEQGAAWGRHWAYDPPRRPALPEVDHRQWVRNPIDTFILNRLEQQALSPSPEAEKGRLLRRVTLALTGLPPTIGELDAFLADDQPGAYERVVDRLLASPRYGEHMACYWLDLARYADTHGYHIDSHRDMWPWRDWVLDAFNRNLPFDQFTVEQLAGDLLPGATRSQRIATGFNRNNMINFEGGALADEYLVEYVADRTVTTGTVWLAQTLQCSRCHDHKYDPFTQRDFFRLFAYFNNVPENGLDGRTGNAEPFIEAPSRLQDEQRARGRRRVAELERALAARAEQVADAQREWERKLSAGQTESASPPADAATWLTLDESQGETAREAISESLLPVTGPAFWLPGKRGNALLFGGRTHLEVPEFPAFDGKTPFSLSVWLYPTTGDRMAVISRTNPSGEAPAPASRFQLLLDEGRIELLWHPGEPEQGLEVHSEQALQRRRWQHLAVTCDGTARAAGLRLYLDGVPVSLEPTRDAWNKSPGLNKSPDLKGPLRVGGDHVAGEEASSGFRGMLDDLRLFTRQLNDTEVALLAGSDPIREIVSVAEEVRSERQRSVLRDYYLQHHDAVARSLHEELASVRERLKKVEAATPTTMVMQEMQPPRTTHILRRGDYRYPTEVVTPGTPASLPPLAPDAPANRLGLARWLFRPDHPLTARVAVNRYWQQIFGEGLVRTPEDFGTRGEPPTHPELLDWLAVEFVRCGWDRKQLHRLLVTSATFRQSSRLTEEMALRDPRNRLWARGPRMRLDAETIRDSALFLSDLLVERQGGPGVYPYQPKGLWKDVSFNPRDFTAQVYTPSTGAALYRRSLYSFWKRAAPPPPLTLLDAPNREICTVRRTRTNTPLQALVLMNEPGFVEAARALAQRILTTAPPGTDQRLEWAFRLVLSRRPTATEKEVVRRMYEQQRAAYANSPQAAAELLTVGHSHAPASDPVELASWTIVASVLLNLDEGVSR